jgi:hypothetical protein
MPARSSDGSANVVLTAVTIIKQQSRRAGEVAARNGARTILREKRGLFGVMVELRALIVRKKSTEANEENKDRKS